MKFAIDKLIHIGLINGWVAANDGNKDLNYNITIRTPEKIIYQEKATRLRPDVKSLGLHETGLCGFSFNAKAYGVREGDLIFIELAREDEQEKFTHSFLYAQQDDTKLQFDLFEIPRDDFSIKDNDTQSLLQDYSHLLALKILLIRLRRNKRAKGFRGQFSGIKYEHKESDWELFYYIVSTFREAILDCLSTRNLFSITDTIADFSTPIERCAAQSLSMFMFHERFAQTINPVCHIESFTHIQPNIQHIVWDGMLSNRLLLDDSLDVYFTRALEVLQFSPLILVFYEKLMLKAMSEKNSIFYINLINSEYFQTAWVYYKTKFENHLKLSFANIEA